MIMFPAASQASVADGADEETEEERIETMVQTLNDEKATSYRCTAETNRILKKRDAREAGLTGLPLRAREDCIRLDRAHGRRP